MNFYYSSSLYLYGSGSKIDLGYGDAVLTADSLEKARDAYRDKLLKQVPSIHQESLDINVHEYPDDRLIEYLRSKGYQITAPE